MSKKYLVINSGSSSLKFSLYESEEQKDPVLIDYDALKELDVELIEDNLLIVEKDNTLKHDSLKLSSLIFSYLMRK